MNFAITRPSGKPARRPSAVSAAIWDSVNEGIFELLAGAGTTTPPIDLKRLSAYAGITRIRLGPISTDGLLRHDSDGYEIILKNGVSRERSRFSWAHEIGHYLINRPDVGFAVHRTASSNAIEKVCDSIAAELLMPLQMFRDEVDVVGGSLSAVPKLARKFGTSRIATAIRLVQTDTRPLALSYWDLRGEKTDFRWVISNRQSTRREGLPELYGSSPRTLFGSLDRARHSAGFQMSNERTIVIEGTGKRSYSSVRTIPTETWSYGNPNMRSALVLSYLNLDQLAMSERLI